MQLRVEGELDAKGVTFTDTGQGWGGIGVLGTSGDLNLTSDTVVEHAEAGVTVYKPATATIVNSTLRDNTVGLDVLSDAGTTVSGSLVTGNGTGIRSGVPQEGPGAPVPCVGSCRSTLTLFDSEVTDNDGYGVYAIWVDAVIQESVMSGNDRSGLSVSNATVDPFNLNILEANGQGALSFGPYDGIGVLAGGSLQMIDIDGGFGTNRVAGNVGRELSVASGGTAFIGTYSPSGTPSDGRNSIYDDTYSGHLVANYSGATLYAGNTYWDHENSPPAGAFTGSVVKWPPASNCDHTVPGDPECIGEESRGAAPRSAGVEPPTRGAGGLRAEILAVREALAGNPAAEDAPVLARTLAALHRSDRGDATGEYAASWGLLRSLRARLNEGQPGAVRPAAEAALEAEAVETLTRGEHGQARDLVAMVPLAEDGSVDRVLGLVEAHLEAVAGNYAEAAAMVEAVAAEEATEGDPESGMAEALYDLAAVFAERAGEGNGARGAGTARLAQASAARSAEPADAREALAVYPNPATATATVVLTLEAATDVDVALYDVLGRRIALLSEGVLDAGTHRFELNGSGLPAGVYLVRADSDERRLTERITLLR